MVDENDQFKQKITELKEEILLHREKKERLQEIVKQLAEIAKKELAQLRTDLQKTKEMHRIDFKNAELQEMIENTLINWDRNFEDAKKDVMDKNHKYIKNLQTNLQKYELKIQTLESKLQHTKAHKQDGAGEVHVSYHGNLDIFDSTYQANKMREMATAIKKQISTAYTNKLLALKSELFKLQN